ncbi:acyl-[acyl-carrier-protein]--UDP-N-acetylglucosamine O-acyltransferase [Plasticicumulans lactativorans]|uniref:Acyl-[acyl-carrier-protein]--UDP-N-acetylglucosamine O-acyltransferase n=1 Tax=Plasticicumulans lactativorans TaxID=1133106 RepID=A0A4R2LG69_9GAMM|nr:acyl-ACP--UDP-N-acetylglucosamine O-acyltransferase [Plasticicumulans lactativorans]TCO83721.1 acyl-[acyl-carrier-protein]--UDP-N-acetylglucosamine O-acyltransferase [Plasticicumulans lactativorans]
MIDARAIVDPAARLAPSVRVGAYSIIGPDVEIDEGTVIGPHVVIKGPTRIGRDNRIFQFASVGDDPQDKKYAGEPTRLEIGDRNTIREYVTINRGTVQDQSVTRLGDDNWIMAYVHVAHDCVIGSRTVFANNASLAGHVHIGDDVILGGFTLVHQFCRIGEHAFCGFSTGVQRDVPPYVTVAGYRAEPHGINAEGLRRRGFSAEEIVAIKRAYRAVYRAGLKLEDAIAELRTIAQDWPRVSVFADFVESSTRGIVR